jgi:hypothetical protein
MKSAVVTGTGRTAADSVRNQMAQWVDNQGLVNKGRDSKGEHSELQEMVILRSGEWTRDCNCHVDCYACAHKVPVCTQTTQ